MNNTDDPKKKKKENNQPSLIRKRKNPIQRQKEINDNLEKELNRINKGSSGKFYATEDELNKIANLQYNKFIEDSKRLERETKLEELKEKNRTQSGWLTPITDFFKGFNDVDNLTYYSYNPNEDKYYGGLLNREVDKDELFNKLNSVSENKAVKGKAYSLGSGVAEAALQVGDLLNETALSIGGLITKGIKKITGNSDELDDVYFKSLVNKLDQYSNKYVTQNITSILKPFVSDKYYKKTRKSDLEELEELKLEESKLNKEGEIALKQRLDNLKNNGSNIFDTAYDLLGIDDFYQRKDFRQNILNTANQGAAELMGRELKSFSNKQDNLSTKTIEINGERLPYEKPGDNNSTSIWDVQRMVIDENGKPVISEKTGKPLYEDKYSTFDSFLNSNWDVVNDKLWWSSDFAQGAGSAIGFVVGGKGINKAVGNLGKIGGKITKTIASKLPQSVSALKMAEQGSNYINNILKIKNKFSKFQTPLTTSTDILKKVNTINNKISLATETALQSYLMTNAESYQIGKQVQNKIINDLVDEQMDVSQDNIIRKLLSERNYNNNSELFFDAQNYTDSLRKKWARENPELFNEILKQSQIAQETARQLNNINFINNLTSAGLFVKGKSFSKNILSNPMSIKSIGKSAWTITREMFQEGFIEEGLINGFAEKAGEKAGHLKYYNLSDFQNQLRSGEFAENVFMGALLGGMQTGGINILNSKTAYNEFKNQKKVINDLSKIGSLKTKEDINQIVQYSLDKENNETIAKRINDLISEGKENEASDLADTLLLNKAVKAAMTGTTDILNNSFEKLLESEELDENDKLEIKKAIEFNNNIAKYYDAHIQYINKSSIIENRGNKDILKNYYNQLSESLISQENDYNNTVDRVIRQELSNESSDYLNDNFNTILENKKQSISLDENLYPTVKIYNDTKKQLKNIQDTIDQLDNEYDFLISKEGQNHYATKLSDLWRKNILRNITPNNINEVKEQLVEQEQLTPEINSTINQKVEENLVQNNTNLNNIDNTNLTNDSEENYNPDSQSVSLEGISNPVQQEFTSIVQHDLFDFDDEKSEWDNFVDTGKISENTLNNIANKIKNNEKLSDKEISIRQTHSEKIEEILNNKLNSTQLANEREAMSLQPTELNDNNNEQKQKIKEVEDIINKTNQSYKNNTGDTESITGKQMFNLFASRFGLDVMEKNFNIFRKAWENTNIDNNFDWNNLYNDYFGVINNSNVFDNKLTKEELPSPTTITDIEQQDSIVNETIQADNKTSGYSQNNIPIKYLGKKIAVPMAKIPFLGIKYRAEIDSLNGTVKYINDENEDLNTEGINNLNIILNPDILVPGTKFNLEIPEDWETRIVSEWKKDNLTGFLNQNKMTMKEWMVKNNIKEGSEEWISKVPMDMVLNGDVIGSGIHDTQWWNTRNVADFTQATINGEKISPEQAINQQRDVINNGRKITLDIRKNVYSGNNKMIITKREDGHTLSNANNELKSLSDTNPNVQLATFSNEGFIINKSDNGNEYFKGEIVNAEFTNDPSHIFMISRLGTKRINNKNIPTYVAYKVHTNHNQKQLQNLVKSRQKLYDAVDILNNIGKFENPSTEQINWANSIKDQVKLLTGKSIDNIRLTNKGIQYLGLESFKQLYPLKNKNGDGLMLFPQFKNINNAKLPIIQEDGTVINYKSKSGDGYKAMLFDHLYTQKRFYDISSDNGTLKILDIQPKIQFELENKYSEEIPKNTITNNDEIVINTDTIDNKVTPITDITFSQRQRIVQFLVNNIYNSIDISNDISNQDIINEIVNSYDKYLSNLKNNYPSEYEYLLKHKDEILGLNNYSNSFNTVKSEIQSFLSQDFDIITDTESGIQTDYELNLDDEGIFEKNNSKTSFENDIRVSLSTRLKLFFSGIIKNNNNKTESFGNLNEFYSTDETIGILQDMLVDISNDENSFENKILNQIEKNPDEFGFLQQILDKFKSAPIEIKKEILYRLNQTKNEMSFLMLSKSKNGNTLMSYDANSKNPNIKIKQEWLENLKQSDLIINFGDTYRIKEISGNKLLKEYESWKDINSINNIDIINWLSYFGITVSDKTIHDYKNGLIEGQNIKSVSNVLYNNLKTVLTKQKTDPEILFKYRAESKNDVNSFNILTNNNSGFLNSLISAEVSNTFNLANNMYIGGKSINAFSQPNYTTEQLRKLKDVNNPLKSNLLKSPFSKNSFLLPLLDNKKIKNALSIGYVSLQSLKQQGQRVYQNSQIVDLSSQDYDILLQGFFQSEGSYFNNTELNDKGIELREMKMTFPTLSDSSQMFLFNTVGLDLKKGNFNITNNKVTLNDEILDILFSQLVLPDLYSIENYIKTNKNINIQGFNLGSQIFKIIPSLNTLSINIDNNEVKLLSILHNHLKTGNSIDTFIDNYKTQINNKIQEVIDDNALSRFNVTNGEISGSWIDNDIINNLNTPKEDILLDNNYLSKRGTTDKIEQLKIATYDFAVNYFINQSQIQMLFAGDISNYIQNKFNSKFKSFSDGTIDVTKPIVSVGFNENQLEIEQKVYTSIIKSASVNMSKRLKELISPGNRLSDSRENQYIQLMIEDVEESSNTLEELIKLWYPKIYNQSKSDIFKLKTIEKEIRNNIKNNQPTKLLEQDYSNIIKKLKNNFPEIQDYLNITATDAQEYTTWKEHLNVLLNQGRITENLYNNIYNKLSSQSENGINDSNKLNEDEKKIIFQPIKPLHAGMYFDNYGDNEQKLQRYVYIKTSSFPLLPELTKNLEIDNLRKNIEILENKTKKNIRVSYQSGNKVGSINNAINISEIYNEYNPELEKKIIDSSLILDRENFSIQQDKPFKNDKNLKNNKRNEINRGTQFEKIILGNGINKITDKIFPNNFDDSLLKELNIKPGENISGQNLYQIYTHLYTNEQKILRNQLYNSLGLNENGDWINNIETLEHIQNILNQRLSNQQDKDILELVYYVTEKDENGYDVNNSYTKEEIESKNLKPNYAEFNIPIWMSPNSRKFESVLNSIINNKLINLKLSGFSSPVASQEGFSYSETIPKDTGIIFTEKFDGELKATHNSDGSLKYAQVLVASKFSIKEKIDGKLINKMINLEDYSKITEDGKKIIDYSKIDESLLQMFSFRIPTSAHQSGALIEIVGFLPHQSGDLMIVPKDHTTQIGEDYDIDTRYVYNQNYYFDENKAIKKIDNDYIQSQIDNLDNNFNNEADLNNRVDNILNLFDSIRENEEIQEILKQDNISRERKIETIKNELKHLLIENQIIDVYKSVFSSTNDEIQKMIGATLSTKFAEDTVEMIEEKLQIDNNNTFSIFDDRHQKSILRLGASGKLGIGVHSNWVVLNSLFQQLPKNPKLINGYDIHNNKNIPFEIRIGNFISDGTLGRIKALEPINKINNFNPRLLSVINMESQNSATDNQKLQIMGRRNENKYTINVFALMSNLGFDKDVLENGKEISLPSLFISQPIIRRYVELKEKYDSITSNFINDVDKLIEHELIREFGKGLDLIKEDNIIKMNPEQMKVVEATELTAQKLYNSLLKGSNSQQWAVYEKFRELSSHAKNINKVQQLSNIDSDGTGISFFVTLNKKDSLLWDMNTSNLNIDNIKQMFGDKLLIDYNDSETINNLENENYIKIEESENSVSYIKPTTPLNAKLISSLSTDYNLWKNIFPFEDKFVNEQIQNILSIVNKEDGTKASLELKYKIIDNMKDYIYSYNNIGIFDNNVEIERKNLFIDTENHESLASYLNKLKKNKHELFNQPFFNELEFVLNKNDKPSLIKYTTNDRTNFNKNTVYSIFSILNESNEELPDFNNNKYSWKLLAKDLTKYSLLSNQENGAIGFRNYIPISILNEYNITKNLRQYSGIGKNESHNILLNGNFRALLNVLGNNDIINNTILVNPQVNKRIMNSIINRINTQYGDGTIVFNEANNTINVNNLSISESKSTFIRQFIQHNPEEAIKLNWKNKKQWLDDSNSRSLDKLTWFTINSQNKDLPEFISIRDSKHSKFLLFEKDNNVYCKISTLGTFGFNEYMPLNNNVVSLIDDNRNNIIQYKTVELISNPVINDIDQVIKNFKLNESLYDVVNNIKNNSLKYNILAETILPFLNNDVKIEVKELGNLANGIYVSKNTDSIVGELKQNTIYIDKDYLLRNGNEQIFNTILEETIHSLTVNELRKYVNLYDSYYDSKGNISINYLSDNIPSYIIKLISIFKEGSKHIFNKYDGNNNISITIDDINEQRKIWFNNDSQITDNKEFLNDTYRTLNIDEFITGILLSDSFRKEMNNIEYKNSNKSILSQFIDVITRLINSIAPGSIKDSITEHTISSFIQLISADKESKSNVYKNVITDKMKQTDNDANNLLNDILRSPKQITENEIQSSKNIGKKIAQLRKERNMTQSDLVIKIKEKTGRNVDITSISELENGNNPSIDLLYDYSKALDIHISEIFNFKTLTLTDINDIEIC